MGFTASGFTAVTGGKENGQNKPPKIDSPSKERRVRLGRLILSVLFPPVTAVKPEAVNPMCVIESLEKRPAKQLPQLNQGRG